MYGNKEGLKMPKDKKEPGTGLKVTKKQKKNFKKFQEGFRSKLGIIKKKDK